MKLTYCFAAIAAALLLTLSSCKGASGAAAPVNVIFETDMGNDIDDAMALDMLYKWVDEGKVNLLAIMINKEGTPPAEFIDIMNTFYGHQVPIGLRSGDAPARTGGVNFAEVISQMRDTVGAPVFARSLKGYDNLPDAVSLYRDILSGMPDKSVKIISVGFLGNLGKLLESDRSLIEKKVISLTTMGGWLTAPNAEFNINGDLDASRRVFADWPTEIVTSPFEVGAAICYPGESIEKDLDWGIPHPMREGYLAYCPMHHDRPCWDLTATLYAVEGAEWFTVSEPGIIDVSEDGLTTFTPQSDGRHRYLSVTPEQAAAIREHFVEIITRKPACRQ